MFRALVALIVLSCFSFANASPNEADSPPGRLKLTGVKFYDPENGVDCVAEYTFMPKGTFVSDGLKYKHDIIKGLSNTAFDPQGNWCRYMKAPIAYPGRESSCFPHALHDESPVKSPQSDHEVKVYDRMGLFTWGFLNALCFDERPNQPKSLIKLCGKKLEAMDQMGLSAQAEVQAFDFDECSNQLSEKRLKRFSNPNVC